MRRRPNKHDSFVDGKVVGMNYIAKTARLASVLRVGYAGRHSPSMCHTGADADAMAGHGGAGTKHHLLEAVTF